MTEDTKRAIEIMKPLTDELKVSVDVAYRGTVLLMSYKGTTQGIGIACNSTHATVMEMIGFLFTEVYRDEFRRVRLGEVPLTSVKRYWVEQELLDKLLGEEEA